MIQMTDSNTCASDIFLDKLHWVENQYYSVVTPPSPVFNPPRDPEHPVNYQLVFYYDSYSYYYHYSNSNSNMTPPYLKNQKINKNQHLRNMGRLKQPGGASCNQRR